MTITIGNRRNGDEGEYVGRPGSLGNPYAVERYGRDEAIVLYRSYFDAALTAPEPTTLQIKMRNRLARLVEMAREGDLTLICWCAPAERCHAEIIKEYIEKELARG